MKTLIALLYLTAFTVFNCSVVLAQPDPLRVGVWNIEKLSTTASRGFPETSMPPRTAQDLEDIAEYIKNELNVDALMITEIEADADESTENRPQSAQLNEICDHLGPNWQYFLGRTGGKMRLGLLFNNERVGLKKLVNLPADEFLVTGADVFDRDPFIVWINALENGQPRNDLILICLHLKSIQDKFRNNRMAAVAKLIGDFTDSGTRQALMLPSNSEEPEVVILGDCNDASFKLPNFKFMFDYLNGVGFAHLKPASGPYPDTRVNGSQIDHIFASNRLREHSMVDDSFTVHSVPDAERDAYRETFSDHFPVTIDVVLETDPDATLAETALIADADERNGRFEALADAMREERGVEQAVIDDEEEQPPQVNAEVIDANFERILAPYRETDAESEVVARAAEPAQIEGTTEAAASTASQALLTSIRLIQDEKNKLLENAAALTPDDVTRLEELMATERQLLRVLTDRR